MKARGLLFLLLFFSVFFVKAQLPGSTCDNPLPVNPVNAPLVNFAINSENYGNDYTSTMVNPSTTYLNGNDIVFSFTLAAKSYINASIAGNRTGLIFTALCPGTPAVPRLAFAGGTSGATVPTFVLDPGSYFMIAGTNPAPQFTDMIINFSAEAVPVDPIITLTPAELYVGMSSPGIHNETKQITIGNQGATNLIISSGGFTFSGPNASNFSVSLNTGDTYPLTIPFGTTKIINVTFSASSIGTANANLNITFNHPVNPTATVPVSGMGYAPMTSFSEKFDGITPVPAGWLPDGWARIVQSTQTTASVNVFATTTAFSLPNIARFQSATDLQAKLFLVSPAATNLSQTWLILPARMGSSSHTGKMQIGYMTSRTDPNTFVMVSEFNITGSFQFYSANFKNSGLTFPEVAFIGIRYVPNATNRILQIDDVKYESVPNRGVFNSSQSSFDFGDVYINETTTQLLQIYNTGTKALRINEFDITIDGSGAGAYSIVYPPGHTWPINLTFGQAINLTLKFTPTGGQVYDAVLNIEDNTYAKINHAIPLTGTGIDATIYPGFNYDMIGAFPPEGWRKFAGNITQGNPTPSTSANWYHGKFGNNPELPENNSAAFMLAAIANYQWLMTPPIELGELALDYQLKFDLAFTTDEGTGPATIGNGQKFGVVVSLDGGLTWNQNNVLQWWNSSTPVSNTGETVIIELNGYSGRIMLAFYAESTAIAPSGRLFVRNVGVDYSTPIVNLPFETGFEEGVFPPEGWSIYDEAAEVPTWAASQFQNHTPGGVTSAFHGLGAEADSWLVTPAILLPNDADIFLRFWSFNANPGSYGKNSVLLSIGSGVPDDGDFQEIWTTGSVSAGWLQTELSLNSFAGEIAFIAFRYEGNNAHEWYLDDISLFASAGLNLSTPEMNHTTALGFASTRHLIISNTEPANLVYSFNIEYPDGTDGWLSVDPPSGNVPFTQNQKHIITFDPLGLGIGTYEATITILSNDYFNPEVTVPVTLNVVQPDNIEFTVMSGQYLNPTSISTDGNYAVLRIFQAHSGYFWSKQNGLVPVPGDDARPRGVSDEGIVAGSFNDPDVLYNGSPVQMAGTWNPANDTWTSIGMNPAVPAITATTYHQGDGISANGQDIVGLQYLTGSSYTAFKKNEISGFEMIGIQHTGNSRATGISKNGATVFGWASTAMIPRFPVVWKNGQMITISEQGGEVRACSPDGNWATGEIGGKGFLWSEESGLTLFSNTIDGTGLFCLGVTNDGMVIGAYGFNFPIEMRNAFVRYTDGTMITFNEYAYSRGLVTAYDWLFYSVNVANPDKQKFAGAGINPQGQTVTFIIDFDAQIPAIQLNPESLSAAVNAGSTAEQQLLVTNTGSDDLVFSTFINYLPGEPVKTKQVPEGQIHEAGNITLQSTPSQNLTSPTSERLKNTFVLNYDGPNTTSIGLTAGGTFYTAIRFPSEMLIPFTGATISSVNVYINQLPTSSVLMIWGPGTTTSPGALLYQQPLQGVATSWNTLSLNTPFLIDGNDLWIGILHNQPAGLFPAGVDAGPANPNGDFLSNNGSVWNRLSDYGFSANWNIRATVQLGEGAWLNLSPSSGLVEPDGSLPLTVSFDATEIEAGNYMASILFITNDPYRPFLNVPVDLTVALPEANILAYAFNATENPTLFADAVGQVDLLNHLVTVEVPQNADLTDLIATFSLSDGVSAQVAGINQVSGVTPNNFTSPVIYTLTTGAGNSQDWTVTVTTLPCLNPWNYVVTGSIHTINIPLAIAPEIFGVPLAPYDWIGVFFLNDSGEETCGGAVQWTGNGNVAVIAYGNDPTTPEKDGFASGEAFRWRLSQCGNPIDYTAAATYDPTMPNQGNFAGFGLSRLTSLKAAHIQYFTLNQGWNGISSYLVPIDADVENMFDPIVNKLTILSNLTSVYWPSQGVNTIGNWNNNSGYAAKVTENVDFMIYGASYASGTMTIPGGWSYLPVHSQCAANVMEMFGGALSDVVIIQDLIGTQIFWPQFGVYTLETFEPGKTYKIKLANAVTVTFPDCTPEKSNVKSSLGINRIESGWGTINMTPNTQTIVLMADALNNFNVGDMIGAFDKAGMICGYVQITSNNQNQAITLIGDDLTSVEKDGFANGEILNFKLMRAESGEVIDLVFEYDQTFENASGSFQTNSLTVVTKATLLQTGIDQIGSVAFQMYPNPAKDLVTFSINTMADEMVTLQVFDTKGRIISEKSLIENTILDVSVLEAGVYFVNIKSNGFNQTKKLVIQH